MPKIEYKAKLLADGHLSCPYEIIEKLSLKVGSQVKLVLDTEPDMLKKHLTKNLVSLRNSIPELGVISEVDFENAQTSWNNKIDKIANEI